MAPSCSHHDCRDLAHERLAGTNPKTGEKIKIAASKSVKFAPGKNLKTKIGK